MNFFSLFKRKILYKIKKKTNIDLDGIKDDTLDDLFHYYGSDKANIFKITQNQGHGFSEFYSKQLDHLRKKDIKILEIGSYSGASASAFIKYFASSKVYCFDINISNFIYYSKNIKVFGLEINDRKNVEKVLSQISVQSNSNFFENIDHILVDQMLTNLKEKKLFNSNIVSKNDQIYFHENIQDITIYKGNLELSDICFIKKK